MPAGNTPRPKPRFPTANRIRGFSLFGRRFELPTVRQTRGEDRVCFCDEHGCDEHGVLKALPAGWTGAGTPDPPVVLAAGRAYFRPEDPMAPSQLIERH